MILALRYSLCIFVLTGLNGASAQTHAPNSITTQTRYLSGKGPSDAVAWDFFCLEGRNAGKWSSIPVPSNWEQHGFGTYTYGNDPSRSGEQARYRTRFLIPRGWSDRKIWIVFEGVMTDSTVRVNGVQAGPTHRGGFYRFRYDITDLVDTEDENLLEVDVSEVSADPSVELAERQADYWVFGGIYRPVFLESKPRQHIDHIATDPRADGSLRVHARLGGVVDADRLVGRVYDANGQQVGWEFGTDIDRQPVTLSTELDGIKPWSHETPNLYRLQLALERDGEPLHTVTETIGFRTFEVREGEGLYLNGRRIMVKGVNRHCFRPETGRALDRADSEEDARLIKSMNMNAVRAAHYPPDTHFLEACDELGLLVIDELATWQKPSLETAAGEPLVRSMVERDVNHPSVILWANGNEGGWNMELDDDFALYDPQHRAVIHPWDNFGGLETDHYEPFDSMRELLGRSTVVLPTEFLHGLYDGGHGASLDDYWNLIRSSPVGAGGFLWVLADEGIVRTDLDGRIDVAGNRAPDGIVGPFHEKEGSFDTIRAIWSPIQVVSEIGEDFGGMIEVENRYDFTDLKTCTFEWELVRFSRVQNQEHVVASGTIGGVPAKPGARARLDLGFRETSPDAHALRLEAFGPAGESVCLWSWPIRSIRDIAGDLLPSPTPGRAKASRTEDTITLAAGNLSASFDAANGRIRELRHIGEGEDHAVPLRNGPRRIPDAARAIDIDPSSTIEHPDGSVTLAWQKTRDGLDTIRWTMQPNGMLILKSSYTLTGSHDFFGVTFDLPESGIRSRDWIGRGPYRVWKNRMRGPSFGFWNNAYNDATPGESWTYPEFKGYFADTVWTALRTTAGTLNIATMSPDLFLRMFTPKPGESPRETAVRWPEGDISFLHAIAPIGTKFNPPHRLGPSGMPTQADGAYSMNLVFWFD